MPPQNPSVRFTPDEIKYLLASGKYWDVQDKMHPDDRAAAQKLFNAGDYHVDENGNEMSQLDTVVANAKKHPGAALGVGAAAAVPLVVGAGPATAAGMVGSAASTGLGLAKTAGGMYAISKLMDMIGASPEVKNAVYIATGLKMGMGGNSPARKQLPSIEGGSGPVNPGNVSKVPPSLSDMERQLTGGGGISVERSSVTSPGELDELEKSIFGSPTPNRAYPPNIDTRSSTDEAARMMGSHSGQGPTPVYYHNGDPEGLHGSIGTLKRTVKRRSPTPPDDND